MFDSSSELMGSFQGGAGLKVVCTSACLRAHLRASETLLAYGTTTLPLCPCLDDTKTDCD